MDFIVKLKAKYPYMTDDDLSNIVDKAKMFYFAIKFPCEPEISEETRPITSFVGQNWILAACDELIEKFGFNSVVGYKENGVSWTFDNAQISDRLINMLTPTIGVIS